MAGLYWNIAMQIFVHREGSDCCEDTRCSEGASALHPARAVRHPSRVPGHASDHTGDMREELSSNSSGGQGAHSKFEDLTRAEWVRRANALAGGDSRAAACATLIL